MVLDRKTAIAGLAVIVVALSQWPVIDQSPLVSASTSGRAASRSGFLS